MTKNNGVVGLIMIFSIIIIASTNNIVDFLSKLFKMDLTGQPTLVVVLILVLLALIDTKLFEKLRG